MADDLAKFIESQKRKLEQERAELLRDTDEEDRSRTSTTGYKDDSRYGQRQPNLGSETKAIPPAGAKKTSNFGGLNLGGYEKVQQKLRQQRHEEYRQYLAEKNFRSMGRVDPILADGGRPNPVKDLQEAKRKPWREPRKDDLNGYNESQPRRMGGKENNDDSPRNYGYGSDERDNQRPANLFESYEDLLQRKRAQERRYRNFDDSDPGFGRPMRLNARQYKHNSRSDGYLSRRFDDDDNEWSYSNRPRGRRERSFESKRVRFQGEEDVEDDNSWVKPRRRLDYYDDDDDEDEEELLDWLRKRGRRPPRRNSAHATERQASKDESLQRSRTDTEIRSQSAPLEGAGVIGGYQESKSAKIKRQEQYKKELQSQMQEQADIKKREKMQRMGLQQGAAELPTGIPQNSQIDNTPPSVNKGSYPLQPQNYGAPLINQGPSSRPLPHQAVFPNPYDDPYYYYGGLEMGAPQAPSMGIPFAGPLNTSPGVMQSNVVAARADTRMSGGYTTPGPVIPVQQVGAGGAVSPHGTLQPPGGYSSLGALGTDQQSASDKKKAAQQAYQEELKKQMEERNLKKIKEKEEKERYDRKIEQEIANYNPWGKGGGGAPLRDSAGHLIANLRTLKQYNDEGIKVSPRDQPQSVQEAYLSPQPGVTVQSELSGNVGKSSFGRSDPLKEPQPQDEVKIAAKQEYQEYLRKQVEEKERKKREELEQQKREDELLEKRINEERAKMQKDFEKEQEENRRKEEQARLKNEEIKEAQEAKKREAERKRKEMEEQRQAELKRKLDEEMAAKRAAASGATALQERSNSPPIPTVQKKLEEAGQGRNDFRSSSPPIPTIAKQQNLQQGPVTPPQVVTALHTEHTEAELSKGTDADRDVLSQLTALRQQLKNEEKKVQQQMDHTTAATKYSKMQRAPEDLGSRRSRRDVDVFERALATKNTGGKSDSETFSAADEFNRIKNEETSSLAEEFRSKFPDPVSTNSVLDLQQQAFLMEQEDKLLALRSDTKRQNKRLGNGGQQPQFSRRPVSRDSLLESESQFLAVEDPKEIMPVEQMQSRPRQSSARERRRWKQLEEMARNPKSYDTYKPPTPGGFSLTSVTSFNVEEVAAQNEERLKRLEMIQRGGQGRSGSIQGDPDRVLQRFIDEHRHPPLLSRLSNQSLEAETSFEPI